MVGKCVMHLDTGVIGEVDAVHMAALDEPTVHLSQGHLLLARSPEAWCVLTLEAVGVLANFSSLVNRSVEYTVQSAAQCTPELKGVLPQVLAAVLRAHAFAMRPVDAEGNPLV
jgi:hypothetical protein